MLSENRSGNPPKPYLLTTEQAGNYLALPPATLRSWRSLGKGPAYVRLAARDVRYRTSDLKAWADARLVGGGQR